MTGAEALPDAREAPDFSPWSPRTLAAEPAHDRFVELRRRVSAAFEKYLGEDLGVGAARPDARHDPQMFFQTAEIDGFDKPLACRIDKRALNVVCANVFGAGPDLAVQSMLHESPILESLVSHIQRALIDRFCKVASEWRGMDFKRASKGREGGAIAFDETSATEILEFDISGGVHVAFILSASDAARLAATGLGNDQAREPAGLESHVRKAVEQVDVTLEAVLDDRPTTLEEMRDWKAGSLVLLKSTPRSTANIVVQGEVLFDCEIVRHDDFFALRVNVAVGDDEDRVLEHE